MEAINKNIQIDIVSKPQWAKSAASIFIFTQKTKRTVLATLFILILVGAPIGIEYILKSLYVITFFTIVVIYPFLYMVYKIDKKMMSCKYMP
jgi:hypothetical protein